MSTKYVVHERAMWSLKIHAYECDKETAAYVWLKGFRSANGSTRTGKTGKVFDTWEEAHAKLTRIAELKVSNARYALQQAQGWAGNVRAMKPPQGEGEVQP